MSNFLNFNGNQGMSFKTFTASGTSYTLDKSASTNSVLVSVGGVMQQPGVDYTVSGTTLTSTSAWTAGVQVDTYIIHKPGTAPTIQDNSIDSDHYVDGSIDTAHIGNDQIDSAHYTAGSIDLEHMSSESVDEDNLHISNAGSNGQFLSKQSGDAGGLTWAAAGGGKLVSRYYAEFTTETSSTSVVPNDDTKPTITEGVQFLTLTTDTLASSSNRLRIFYGGPVVSSQNGAAMTVSLFDGATEALSTLIDMPTGTDSYEHSIFGSHEYAPGATTAKTFTLRYGANHVSYTMYINRFNTGRKYGGAAKWVLIVEEIEP